MDQIRWLQHESSHTCHIVTIDVGRKTASLYRNLVYLEQTGNDKTRLFTLENRRPCVHVREMMDKRHSVKSKRCSKREDWMFGGRMDE